MRELKAYRPRELVMQGRHNEPIYLKSEADKFIAENDAEIAGLKEKLNNSRNARKYWRKEYLIEYKESIHHYYKIFADGVKTLLEAL